MERRRSLTLAAVTVLIAAAVLITYVARFGLEASFLSERLVYVQRAVTATGSASPIAHVQMNEMPPANLTAAAAEHANEILPVRNESANVTTTGIDRSAEDELVKLLAEQIATKKPEPTTATPRQDESDELMTLELIQRVETQRVDPLSPIQVHMIWIGDINRAPKRHIKYTKKGFNVTIHTSAEEILEGFHPFMLRAYNLAIPQVVGFDFLKFALLYKYGGFVADVDTWPVVSASEIKFPSDCDIMFGKEAMADNWEKPVYRDQGGASYGLTRPFQLLNWAMVAAKPRNKHIKWFLQTAMMHFFGLRDMEYNVVQDIAGSGVMTDYVALLHEKAGRSYRDVYLDTTKYVPVDGLCITDAYLRGKWINHDFIGTWKNTEAPLS